MRIACFANSLATGGAEKVCAQLTYIWASLGHETVLFTALQKEAREYDCCCMAREIFEREKWVDPAEIARLHEKFRFDVAVFNGGVSRTGFGDAVDWLKLHGIRTIMILHHTANNWLYTLSNYEDVWIEDVWRKIDAVVCVDRMWALWWKYRGVKSVFVQNPVSVSSRSPGGLEGLEGSECLECLDGLEGSDGLDGILKKPLPQTTQTYKPLTLVKSVDEAVERLRGKKNIIWVGRLNDPLKRPELAVEVFSKLVCEWRSGGVEECPTLTMLGACDKAVEKRLRKCFAANIFRAFKTSQTSKPSKLSEPPKLSFPGFITNVGEYLAKADAHLFTSATEVTVPQVVLEAQAAGVETVAFDQPVLREGLGGLGCFGGSGGLEEKWRKVLAGEAVECDFDTPEMMQNLMDELQRSQRWFVEHYLAEFLLVRRLKQRMDLRYLTRRFVEKLRNRIGL